MKILYLLVGILSLVLGTIGAFLPVLPTTPFLILSSVCFAKSSNRFHTWLVSTNLYKNNLETFVNNREMKLSTKIKLMTLSTTMILISVFMVKFLILKIMLILMDAYKYYYFIYKIKTIK